jgi:hypothetical protein
MARTASILHNVLKEYFAASVFVAKRDAGDLARRSLDAEAPYLFLFAVGCARDDIRFAGELIATLLDGIRSDQPAEQRRLQLLALVAAHGARLEPDLLARLDRLLGELLPPRSLEEAEAAASLGDRALPHLRYKRRKEPIAAACARALWMIGTADARQVLRGLIDDRRESVALELANAFSPFEIPFWIGRIRSKEGGLPEAVGRQITDLGPLASWHDVEVLRLDHARVADLSPLAELENLQRLSLRNTGVLDLGPLRGLTSLESLDLMDTSVSSLGPLRYLRNLKSLVLMNTGVSDLGPLRGLTSLELLNLMDTSMSDLEPLRELASLRELDLSDTRVTDLGPLRALASLQWLDLGGTGVTDLGPLLALASLQWLDLGGTGVTDLGPLRALASLQRLILSGTGVTDLGPLLALASLRELDLSDTWVADLGPLRDLASLQWLGLFNTPVSDEEVARFKAVRPEVKIFR